VPDVSWTSLNIIIDWMYGIDVTTHPWCSQKMDLVELISVAAIWGVTSLQHRIENMMCRQLSIENYEAFISVGELLDSKKIPEAATKFMIREKVQVTPTYCGKVPNFTANFFEARAKNLPKQKCYISGCLEEGTELCGKVTPGCSQVYYCSSQCNLMNWDLHRPECEQIRDMDEDPFAYF